MIRGFPGPLGAYLSTDGETMSYSARWNASAATLAGVGVLGAVLLAGCGASAKPAPAPSEQASAKDGQSDAASPALPTASIGGASAGQTSATQTSANSTPAEPPLPKEGSPEWLLGQMIVLFGEPLPAGATIQERTQRLRER